MAPLKRKPPQPAMSKAELRAQGVQALAQVTTPITKLPMKIRRQCKDCGRFNSVLVEPGEAVPAFKCSTCSWRVIMKQVALGARIRNLSGPRRSSRLNANRAI
jgi:DNA-directed RNA polymerase subunit RPC12/RpoP